MIDNFNQRKKDILEKADKSSIGSWDEKIISLCEKINGSDNYYTTSSCAGRIVLMKDEEKKGEGLFLGVWHDKVNFEELKKELENILDKGDVKFKTEPPIIHIACRDLKSASKLLEEAKHIGFKRSGVNAISKNIILELCSTEKLEFPIIQSNKILVDDEFLEVVIQKSNFLLNRGWVKIEKLIDFF
ncbi:MAG: tRNA wybutosine-synthesizing 3 family protein [Candidatus Pacearchaeota archaeon]|nr:tRNA wybutosine-synthesizing 3 family protein [Candidatus Pacearchaeota archaeon]